MYINTATLQYPVSERDIRNLNPNTSYPASFPTPEGYAVVFPAPTPTCDPITEIAREIQPVLTSKGTYEQAYEIVPRFQEYADAEGVVHTVQEQEDAARDAAYQATIPKVVTIRQAKLALLQSNLLDDVEAAMTQAGRATQIEWEYATEFERDWPALTAMQPLLGLTDTQIDDLFKLASGL
jgi:hypothetical protein